MMLGAPYSIQAPYLLCLLSFWPLELLENLLSILKNLFPCSDMVCFCVGKDTKYTGAGKL